MSSWSGFEDDNDSADGHSLPSRESSPFSTAFHILRPPGIQTGMRDVPPDLSQYPEENCRIRRLGLIVSHWTGLQYVCE